MLFSVELCHWLVFSVALQHQRSSQFCLSSFPVVTYACRSQTATEDLINCLCVSESVIGVLWGSGSDVALCSLWLNRANKQISDSPGKCFYLQPAGRIPTGRAHVSPWLIFIFFPFLFLSVLVFFSSSFGCTLLGYWPTVSVSSSSRTFLWCIVEML